MSSFTAYDFLNTTNKVVYNSLDKNKINRFKNILLGCVASSLAISLSACGGGGGGNSLPDPDPIITPPAPGAEPPILDPELSRPPIPLPDKDSWEYTHNWGVGDTKAYSAWEQGATGKGVTVAVIDSGVASNLSDLSQNIVTAIDINTERNAPEGISPHGQWVSSVIAAPFNETGTVGIAYNADILSIRADNGSKDVMYYSTDLKSAIAYAVDNGAQIVNLSLGNNSTLGAGFEAALKYGVDAGLIFAIAAGNQSDSNPQWPARYANDPRFAGSIIAVGAHSSSGQMSSFSNRAGVSMDNYITAPGEDIIVGCDNGSCWSVKGTSYATPAVAAAMALLKEAFPNLTNKQIVSILLESAADQGEAGTDVVWGRGKLDIQAAFQPIGTPTTPSASGSDIVISAGPGTFAGSAFGDALARTSALQTIGYDRYNRLFRLNAAEGYRIAPRRSYQAQAPSPLRQTRVSTLGPIGTRLTLAASTEAPEPEPIVSRNDLYDAPWMGSEDRRQALMEVTNGRLSLSTWQGEGGLSSPFETGAGDSFTSLAQSDHAVRGSMRLAAGPWGEFVLSADSGGGDRQVALQPVERDAARYGQMGLDWRFGKGLLNLSAGELEEELGPLGSYMPSRSDLSLPSTTRFAAVGGDIRLNERLSLNGQVGFGRTEMEGQFMTLTAPAISSTWTFGLTAACEGWWSGCSTLVWELSQPIRIEKGTFDAYLADVPLEYSGPVTFSHRRFSAAPSGREIDMSIRTVHPLPNGSALRLEAVGIHNEQHRKDAEDGYAIRAFWTYGF